MRVTRAIHQRIARFHALAFLHVDVDTTRNGVFLLHAVVADYVQLTHTLTDFAVFHSAVDFRNHSRFARLASFEQFHHAGQTTGDVFGLGGSARDLRDDVAGV